jgi:DnaK suppressor protein
MVTSNLTGAQIANLRSILKTQAQELRTEIRDELLRSEHGEYADLAGRVHDPGEESVANLLAEQNIAIVAHQTLELRAVELALQRINTDYYGVCSDCFAPIAYPRLQAQPSAERCIVCQTKKESSRTAS